MRDPHFILIRRGGLLTDSEHRLLMGWALECTEHLVSLQPHALDTVLIEALSVARNWQAGEATTYMAMKASRTVHAFARSLDDPLYKLLCRAIGQAVATAHMADHSMGPCWYGMKIVRLQGGDVEAERIHQLNLLQKKCPSLYEIVGAHLAMLKV